MKSRALSAGISRFLVPVHKERRQSQETWCYNRAQLIQNNNTSEPQIFHRSSARSNNPDA